MRRLEVWSAHPHICVWELCESLRDPSCETQRFCASPRHASIPTLTAWRKLVWSARHLLPVASKEGSTKAHPAILPSYHHTLPPPHTTHHHTQPPPHPAHQHAMPTPHPAHATPSHPHTLPTPHPTHASASPSLWRTPLLNTSPLRSASASLPPSDYLCTWQRCSRDPIEIQQGSK